MVDQKKRRTIRSLSAGSAVSAAGIAGSDWAKPVVKAVSSPAHASMSSLGTIEIYEDDAFNILAPLDTLNIDTQYFGKFIPVPNPGPGVNYQVGNTVNDVEQGFQNYQTELDGNIYFAFTAGVGFSPGDIECYFARIDSEWNPWAYECRQLQLIASDINIKENISVVDNREVLQQLMNTRIAYWNYRKDGQSVRHIGPMAQDFSREFDVGDSDRQIYTVDAQGVNMASIQALYELLLEKDRKIDDLQQQIDELKNRLAS